MKHFKSIIKVGLSRFFLIALVAVFIVQTSPKAFGISAVQLKLYSSGVLYFDPAVSNCLGGATGSASNLAYDGKPILSGKQLALVAKNTPIYQQAALEYDIPWQMLAALHYREHSLLNNNPNGAGIYQITGGNYVAGSANVPDAEFLDQTLRASKFIKSKVPSLTANSDIKDINKAFFYYNGAAQVYVDQAKSMGFSDGYEGSPYVMNKFDAKRDSDVLGKSDQTWGQIRLDGGPILYPAGVQYGAFVVYASLAGLSGCSVCPTNNDDSSVESVRSRVVCLAKQELDLWQNGKLKGVDNYGKYSQNRSENWCADFASWVYNQASYPLSTARGGNISTVLMIKEIGDKGNDFLYHSDSAYIPKPGDMAIISTSSKDFSHLTIVVSVSENKLTLIGGNQGGDGDFNLSAVTSYEVNGFYGAGIVGYVSPE